MAPVFNSWGKIQQFLWVLRWSSYIYCWGYYILISVVQYGAVWCSMVQYGAAGSAAPKNSYGVSVAVERRAEVGDIVFLGLEVL